MPEPEFDVRPSEITITFPHLTIPMSESMSELMSELEQKSFSEIMVYLKTHSSISANDAAEQLHISYKSAYRLLVKAEKINLLISSGKTKAKVYRKRIERLLCYF